MKIRPGQVIAQAATTPTDHDDAAFVVTGAAGQSSPPLAKRQAVVRMAGAVTVADAAPEAVAAELSSANPGIDVGRWSVQEPLHGQVRTWVLSKMWGFDSPTWLAAMATLVPAGVVTSTAHSGD